MVPNCNSYLFFTTTYFYTEKKKNQSNITLNCLVKALKIIICTKLLSTIHFLKISYTMTWIYVYIHTQDIYKHFCNIPKYYVPRKIIFMSWTSLFFLMECHFYLKERMTQNYGSLDLDIWRTFSWKWTWASPFKKITDRWQFTVLPLIKGKLSRENQISGKCVSNHCKTESFSVPTNLSLGICGNIKTNNNFLNSLIPVLIYRSQHWRMYIT